MVQQIYCPFNTISKSDLGSDLSIIQSLMHDRFRCFLMFFLNTLRVEQTVEKLFTADLLSGELTKLYDYKAPDATKQPA